MLRLDERRLLGALDELAGIGAIEGGGCARLALTDEDKAGRDLVVGWMKALGLDVRIDAIGNVIGAARRRREPGAGHDRQPHRHGAHRRPLRRQLRRAGRPGSRAGAERGQGHDAPADRRRLLHQRGGRALPARHDGQPGLCRRHRAERGLCRGRQGRRARSATSCAASAISAPPSPARCEPHAFVELHIEQGPILDEEKVQIGVVESVQGISWTEYTVTGVSNHAGTTPMRLRRDAGYLAASVNRLRAQARLGDGRQPGGDGGRAGAAAQPDQRRAQPRGVHRRPAQHRRGEAQGGRGARRCPHRRSRRGRACRGRGQGAGAFRAGDLRRRPGRSGRAPRQGAQRSARDACRRARATTRR